MSFNAFGVNVTVYPEDFQPLLKVINRAIAAPEQFELTAKELESLQEFQDDFADLALEYGVNA
jgi:hypothetical protein